MIKQKLAIIAAAVALAACVTTSQAALSLNFSSVVGANIQFGPGSQFGFNPNPGSFSAPQWQITTVTGGGAALGKYGWFNGGPWTIGVVNTVGSVQSANVVGSGQLVIWDGGPSGNASSYLTGTVNWGLIQTTGSAGAINAALNINLSGLSYSGLNADLIALANGKNGSVNLTFQFNPGKTLSELVSLQQGLTTSYSGSITAIPEPSTVVAGALLLLPFGVSTIRILRKNRS